MPPTQGPNLQQWTLLILGSLSCGLLHALHCPSHCRCDHTTLDCSNRRLSSVPHIHPHSSALSLNLSSNSLTSLDAHSLPVPQTSLDLSHNRISTIPLNTFSGEQYIELHSLNLSSNHLSHANFVFPSSLKVLKLSNNKLQQFCVERLKGLSRLSVLNLEMNTLETLECAGKSTGKGRKPGKCPIKPLMHISEVWLNGNKLKDIHHASLLCFQNTRFLSLADNEITSLSPKTFQTFQHLRYLDLSGNKLTFVAEGMFLEVTGLKYLSLARNALTQVPGALPMLEWLDLSHNAIASVPESQKSDLYPQEVFLIGGNPFHCVCSLLWLKELFDTREYLLKFVDVEKDKFIPACTSPAHIQGDSWDVLGDSAFGCKDNEEADAHISVDNHQTSEQEELAVKVRDVGTTHIRLDWDSLQLNGDKLVKNKGTKKVYVTCHPFGKKQEKKTAIVQFSLGSYRLRNLQPSTAYVVCLSLGDGASGEGGTRLVSRHDCMEVVTKDDEQSDLRDIYMRISVVVIVSVLLTIKCCYTNSMGKDISSRHKHD